MASKRCIPTRFFKDPDIVNLKKDTQLILIGLVLYADDEGREIAHTKVLAQEMFYPLDQVEAALKELVENDLLILYEVGKYRYYSLAHQWQSMGGRFTPSKYPAPPQEKTEVGEPGRDPQQMRGNSRQFPADAGKKMENASQFNSIQLKRSQEKRTEEKEDITSENVIPFPIQSAATTGSLKEEERRTIIEQVARILKLPISDALARVVDDFLHDPTLSVLGEADAAGEYIETPQRNKQQQKMSPAFFRRWLKRAQEGYHPQGQPGHGPAAQPQSHPLGKSLMDLEATYRSKGKQKQANDPPCEKPTGEERGKTEPVTKAL